jgi:hypothetical protein
MKIEFETRTVSDIVQRNHILIHGRKFFKRMVWKTLLLAAYSLLVVLKILSVIDLPQEVRAIIPVNFPNSSKVALVRNLNNYRRNPKVRAAMMNELTWNFELESAILQWLEARAAEVGWRAAYGKLYETDIGDCKPVPGYNHSKFLFCMFDLPEFSEFKRDGCEAIALDSCKRGRWVDVVTFRLTKPYCFNYHKCSNESYTGYQTCNGYKITKEIRGTCANFWMYQPRFYRDDYKNVALIATDVAPPAVAGKSQDSGYILFGCKDGPAGEPINDVPYKKGPRGSECWTKGRILKNGLCATP